MAWRSELDVDEATDGHNAPATAQDYQWLWEDLRELHMVQQMPIGAAESPPQSCPEARSPASGPTVRQLRAVTVVAHG